MPNARVRMVFRSCARLVTERIATEDVLKAIEAGIDAQIDAALDAAMAAYIPDVSELKRDVFAQEIA
jgi:acetoin:2,6-dichlorophenolindophenol oxidoreductase subunit alpha